MLNDTATIYFIRFWLHDLLPLRRPRHQEVSADCSVIALKFRRPPPLPFAGLQQATGVGRQVRGVCGSRLLWRRDRPLAQMIQEPLQRAAVVAVEDDGSDEILVLLGAPISLLRNLALAMVSRA